MQMSLINGGSLDVRLLHALMRTEMQNYLVLGGMKIVMAAMYSVLVQRQKGKYVKRDGPISFLMISYHTISMQDA